MGRLRLVGVADGAVPGKLARDDGAGFADSTGNLGGLEMAQAPDLVSLAKRLFKLAFSNNTPDIT